MKLSEKLKGREEIVALKIKIGEAKTMFFAHPELFTDMLWGRPKKMDYQIPRVPSLCCDALIRPYVGKRVVSWYCSRCGRKQEI